jgi:transposase
VLYVLRTGIPWRDLPKCYGNWHTVYMRFNRWNQQGIFWTLLYKLQQLKHVQMDIVFVDSSTVPIHRHGSGALKKKAHRLSAEAGRA